MSSDKTRTITMTDRPPVRIREADWPPLGVVAGDAVEAARAAAAGVATGDAIEQTVQRLQASASDLAERMLSVVGG